MFYRIVHFFIFIYLCEGSFKYCEAVHWFPGQTVLSIDGIAQLLHKAFGSDCPERVKVAYTGS